MRRDAKQLREAAASLVAECGSYATMAALFLASEAQQAGQAEEAVDWVRIAGRVAGIGASPASRRFVVFPIVAGRA